jgi:type IV secretion system protein VirD4
MISTYDKKEGRGCNPVLLIVDEAGRTPIPMLADHASTVVGRKISLWIAVQSLSQLETVYGKPRANTLRENMETQLYYRPSSQETAEYLERCLGRLSQYAHSKTQRDGTHISLGLSEQGIPLMTAGEIKQMRDEQTIAFHRNLPPMRLKRMDWRRHQTLLQRHSILPPLLPTLPPITDIQIRNTDPLIDDNLIDPDAI